MHRSEGGFTIIEMIVAATFAAIALVAIVELFIGIEQLNARATRFATATQAAHQKMEAYRNMPFNTIPASSNFTSSLPANLGLPRSATATFHDLSPAISGLKQLDIVIYYTDGPLRRDVQMSTLIAAEGIDR